MPGRSACLGESVKEMFGSQLMGMILKGTGDLLELAGPIPDKAPLLTCLCSSVREQLRSLLMLYLPALLRS